MPLKARQSHYRNMCARLKDQCIYRELPSGRAMSVNFCDNDYLGLKTNPRVIQGCLDYARKYGIGSGASRLLLGNQDIYLDLEAKIALGKKYPAALLLNTGYQGNASVIAALLDKKTLGAEPLVFTDRLNHNSIHAGCAMASCKQIRYDHLDMNHLESLLQKHMNNDLKYIISETVFGMDGDAARLEELTALAEKHNAFLYLDEAHATGLYGFNGYGMTTGLHNVVDCSFGTFSKAVGVFGGYIACSCDLKEYLINKCGGFIYSTALPPSIIGAISAAWEEIPKLRRERKLIIQNAAYLRTKLTSLGLDCIGANTNIVCVLVKDTEKLIKIQTRLQKQGVLISAIRPPTVPTNSSRIRIAVCSHHTLEQINFLIDSLLLAWQQI